MYIRKIDISNSKSEDENRVFFETLDSLQMGEAVELINSHDPKALCNLLSQERPNEFECSYVEEGPDNGKFSVEKKYLSFI